METTLREYNKTIYKIYCNIDGEKCVRRISDILKMPIEKLNDYLLNLLEHGIIYMIDIFRFANHYDLTTAF